MRGRDSHVKVLDGLLSIDRFARKGELRVALRVVNVHGCVHGRCQCAPAIVSGAVEEVGAAVPDESNEGQSGKGEGEGSTRDDGRSPA